jgi:O-succinylbenzoic acid--CoA ligase
VGGATVVIPQQRRNLAATITDHGITHVSLVSTQLIRLLHDEQGRNALQQLKAILLGGSAMPRAALDEVYTLDLPIHISYGLTEMGSQVATTPRGVPADKRSTSGRVLPFRELKIGTDAQIMVRGETRFAGYVEGFDLRQPFDADGWYATGDLGWLDADGYLHVQGRKDNMFISGGENIQPEEIEAVLLQMNGIEQAMVVPMPDAEFGFRPGAFVKTHNVAHEQIVAFLAGRLPRFKIPRTFLPWPEQIATAGIKVSRKQMQRLALEHTPG